MTEEANKPTPEQQRIMNLYGVHDSQQMRQLIKDMSTPLYHNDPRKAIEFIKKEKGFSTDKEAVEWIGYTMPRYESACKEYDRMHAWEKKKTLDKPAHPTA